MKDTQGWERAGSFPAGPSLCMPRKSLAVLGELIGIRTEIDPTCAERIVSFAKC